MAYQHRIEATPEELAAWPFHTRGVHSYMHLTLDQGAALTVRVGSIGVRLTLYPSPGSTERAVRDWSFADAYAVTTWVPNPRELGDGHWLHTFQHADLLGWARMQAGGMLADIAAGRMATDRMVEDIEPRLHSSAEVAAALGISQRRVQQLAVARRVGREIGGSRVFRQADIEALRDRGKRGRPPKNLDTEPPRTSRG